MLPREEMELLCELSKLSLTEEEMEKYGSQMEQIIGLMDVIGESNFEYDPIDRTNAVPYKELREDKVSEFKEMERIVENAPDSRDNQFVVPKIVD